MTAPSAAQTATSPKTLRSGRLFFLELSGDRIHSVRPDGSDLKTIVSGTGRYPDGIAVDVEGNRIFWTNMGVPHLDDGSIECVDLDGGARQVIVPQGGTHTPKQLHLDKAGGKLYWCDREGMRVMRCNLDGSQIETLVESGDPEADRGDQTKWCVGITVDPQHGAFYWSQKGPDDAGRGRIFRASVEMPANETPAHRSDTEVMFEGLPEPIDLEFDHENRVLYWTDRGDPPAGNTVSRAPVDRKSRPEILVTHLMEAIGLALDLPGGRMFVTDLAGTVYVADLNGGALRPIAGAQGNITGIAYAEV